MPSPSAVRSPRAVALRISGVISGTYREVGLPLHTQRRCIHQEPSVAEHDVVPPIGRTNLLAEALAQSLGPAAGTVDDYDALKAPRDEAVDHRARRAARAKHHRLVQVAIPTRRAGVEIVQKALDVRIGRA
jgi:hypothetical protein